FAIQVGRPLTDLDRAMRRITLFLLVIAATGIALAAALGLLVSRAALAPVRRLTKATETVTKTGDLSERIDVRRHDELGRLASSFNTMLGALEESTRAKRQLVADASHELRTPLTSLRTNIEVLASERSLRPGGAAGRASRRWTCRTSSTGSTAPAPRGACPAPGSGSRSSARSPRRTAARWSRSARRVAGR